MKPFVAILAFVLLLLGPAAARADDKVDLAAVHRIKAEATARSQVMEYLFWLTDANGPRLTHSPGHRAAAQWAEHTLEGIGASNVHLETSEPRARGWSYSRFSARLVAPSMAPLGGAPKAWSGGTSGPVTAELVLAPVLERDERNLQMDLPKLAARHDEYIARYRGKLRGKIVLVDPVRDLELSRTAPASRYDDPELATEATAVEPTPPVAWTWPLERAPADRKKRSALFAQLPFEVIEDFWERMKASQAKLADFFREEGVAAVLSTDDRGDGAVVFAEEVPGREPGTRPGVPWVVLAPESYNRLARLAEHQVQARVELDLAVTFDDSDLDGHNVIGELPGAKKRDEVVMIGAHLDSWHAGTGANDNGAGCAVVLEALRILKAAKLPLDRTVRVALWDAEEEGLYGSRSYVKQHFGDPATMKLRPEHAKLAAYFNLDNGSGKIRGVYLQGNDMVRPIFESWLAPFRDTGATTLSIRNTGGTDHLSFDSVGLPGFQFIQDPLDYMTRVHHSSVDVYDHAQASDLIQAAEVLAAFVYHAANRAELLPRKPLPPPLPPKRTETAAARDP